MRLRPAKRGRDPDTLLNEVPPSPNHTWPSPPSPASSPPPNADAKLHSPPAQPSLPPLAPEPASALALPPPPSPAKSRPAPPYPWPRIEIYCLPFWDEKGSGCYMVVEKAKPGASLSLKLTSRIGEPMGERKIQLMPDSSTAYRRVYWKDPSHRQVKLYGVVRYTDEKERMFYVLGTYKPSDRSCKYHMTMPHTDEPAIRCVAKITLPNGGVDTVVTYYTPYEWSIQ